VVAETVIFGWCTPGASIVSNVRSSHYIGHHEPIIEPMVHHNLQSSLLGVFTVGYRHRRDAVRVVTETLDRAAPRTPASCVPARDRSDKSPAPQAVSAPEWRSERAFDLS